MSLSDVELLDIDQLEMLFEAGDEVDGLMAELFELFNSECVSKFRCIDVMVDSMGTSAAEIARQAHAIAGSSANIGAKRMWALAKKIESLLNSGDSNLALSYYGPLKECFSETLEALRAEMELRQRK